VTRCQACGHPVEPPCEPFSVSLTEHMVALFLTGLFVEILIMVLFYVYGGCRALE